MTTPVPKVSVIVPAYNAEKTIGRCVDSILHQDFHDLELIVMDDGSTDGTPDLLDAYARQDDRVRVVHKPNSGVSDTRNQALDLARGEWVQFLDADDWIVPEATKLLVRSAEENDCQMVVADFYRVIGKKVSRKGDIDAEGVLTREDYGDYMMQNPSDFYYGVLWNKLYRRDIIEAHELRMDTSLDWCEDFIFNMEYVLHTRRIYPLHVPIYYYVKTPGSLATAGANPANVVRMKVNVIEYYDDFYKQMLDEEDYQARRPDILRFYVEGAGDDQIMPWQKSQRLGDEQATVYDNPAMGDSVLLDAYYGRKLLEHYLGSVAKAFDLEMRDVAVVAFAMLAPTFGSRAELADFAGVSQVALGRSIARLRSRRLLQAEAQAPEEKGAPRAIRLTLTDEAQPLCDAIRQALRDADRVRYDGLAPQEADRVRQVTHAGTAKIRRLLG